MSSDSLSESSSSSAESGEEQEKGFPEGEASSSTSGMGGGAGFADALTKILKKPVAGNNVVLAKRKTSNMKKIEEERRAQRAQKRARKEKLERDRMCMELPSKETEQFERNLRKIATKGVVAFFNAVSEAQNPKKKKGETSHDSKPVSKEKSFDMLQKKSMKIPEYLSLFV